ncbi:hypothetical protein [Streptomyces caeruleatus]|uniref:hypothetical protein n=1 Tax=Streptomyces caeruleatus TaxID=661399 RepID=UPI000AB6D8A5|nr:hypothetical protein [Streptomyces caeruleatus]
MALLSRAPVDGSYVTDVLPPLHSGAATAAGHQLAFQVGTLIAAGALVLAAALLRKRQN